MPTHVQRRRSAVVEFLCWLADGPVAILRWLGTALLTLARWSMDVGADLLHGGRPTTISLAERIARIIVLTLTLTLLAWGVVLAVS